ncbi:MAG TPA: NAD(P)/FAD-dependent oxidoreductase [Tepidisphaeraceae bacterium]|jgi:NADH dehydrogenase|nr:NAD(P)/FAD-dependent oxidoreductase [Tepidisphaeraceae bacterium]
MASAKPGTRVLILGGGFGGVHTARSLRRHWKDASDNSITLISKENYFLMTPLLFEAGSGVLEPRHAVTPIRRMFQGIQFAQATVQSIDIDGRSVEAKLTHGEVRRFEFDHLVLALGGVTNTQIIPGADKARTFKTLYDAITLRNHCIRLFERADAETDEKLKRALLTFVIVGGGLVGLELQGELTEFIESIHQTYPRVDKKYIRFELIEGGPRLVPELDEDLGDYAAKTLAKRGVNVRLNTRVDSMGPSTVRLPGGEEIESHTIVLATGVVPNPLISTLPVEKDRKGRVAVEGTMRSRSHPNIWSLGDCAAIPDAQGKPYPPLAQHALREARLLGKNMAAVMRGAEPRPFIYSNKGTLAALGRHKGIGRVYGIKIYGFVAWWVWRTYYLLQMPRFDRKLRIVIDWTVALFFKNDVVELDMTSRR